MGVSIHDFEDWRAQQTSFEDIAAYYAETVNVGRHRGRAHPLSRGLRQRAPVRHPAGPSDPRTHLPARGGPAVDAAGDDPELPGLAGPLPGRPAASSAGPFGPTREMTTIVGVMPEKFGFPGQMDAWLPLRIDPLAFPASGGPALEGTQLQAVGPAQGRRVARTARRPRCRPSPGGSPPSIPSRTRASASTVMRQADTLHRSAGRGHALHDARRGVRRAAHRVRERREPAARPDGRPQQGGRDSHGARRRAASAPSSSCSPKRWCWRLPVPAPDCVVAKVGMDFFNAGAAPPRRCRSGSSSASIPPSSPSSSALTVLSTLLAGTIPALRASQDERRGDHERRSRAARRACAWAASARRLVVAQLAVSCGLLVAAGLMIRTVVNVARFDYGFDTANVFTARLGLFEKDYPTPLAQRQFYDALLDRLQSGPARRPCRRLHLRSAGARERPDAAAHRRRCGLSNRSGPSARARRIVITPGYFDVVGVKPVARTRLRPHGQIRRRACGRDRQRAVRPLFFAGSRSPRQPASSSAEATCRGGRSSASCPTCTSAAPSARSNPRNEGVYIPLDAERDQLHEPGRSNRAGPDDLRRDHPGRGEPDRPGAPALLGPLAERSVRARHLVLPGVRHAVHSVRLRGAGAWRPSASTGSCRSRRAAARGRSASAWRSARTAATSCC